MVARKAARLALNLTSLRPSVTAPLPLKINWFFYFSCLASIGLDTSAPIFHWNHMESATFDWSITFVERWIFRSPPKHTHIGIILRLELNVLTLHWYQVEKICTADDTVGTDGTVRTAALQSLMCAFGSPLPVFALFFFFFPSPSLATHLRWRRPSASSFCSAATWWWISL